MMFPLRRSHALVLAGIAALLLLLLARSPPSLLAPPHPRAIPLLPRTEPDTSTPQHNRTAPPACSYPAPPSPISNITSAPSPAPVIPPRDPRVLYTGDVYVAGHSRPHPELCPALGARLRLLILVTSAPSHSSARAALRLTWGHYAQRRDISLGFVIGAPSPTLQPQIDAEDALYGDIIIGRFVDTYSNLTLKTLSMLEWTDTYCPRVKRLLKTDDDMFINVPKLLQFMAARENDTKTIWGKVMKKSLPARTTKSKYYVPILQYAKKQFPDFNTGPAYLMTTDLISGILKLAPDEPYLRLEDVFITGVLAGKLGARRVHAAEFYNKKVAAHPCAIQRGVAIHMVRYHEQFDLWRKLLDGKTKCNR